MDLQFNEKSNSSTKPPVRRWDGNSRLSIEWDNLRRDPELWLDTGDCLVYLHASGQSQRGPSFLVPFTTLEGTTLEGATSFIDLEERQPWDFNGSFFNSERFAETRSKKAKEIFLVAPDRSSKESAFDWHITTRNYFAFCCGRALTGRSLGQSLVSLHQRLQLWRPDNKENSEDVMRYANELGYLKFSHCPDYALAMLQYAEHLKIDDLWVDAFTHCVGMNDMLAISNELQYVAYETRSLIEESSASMRAHLERITQSLGSFLLEDLSPANLGLSPSARAHLDQFRGFLQQFYVRKFGYWPPARLVSKSAFQSMHSDFRHLYNYLVDLDSSSSISKQGFASGGICVFQNIRGFDSRQQFEPLPHPLPLLPPVPLSRTPSAQRALSALKPGQNRAQDAQLMSALLMATNGSDKRVSHAPLVKEYQKFECDSVSDKSEKLSFADARKVRWILIYCTFQLLNSIIEAPHQVRGIDSTTYFMCCDIPDLLPWSTASLAHRSGGVVGPVEEAEVPVVPKENVPTKSSTPVVPTSPMLSKFFSTNIAPDCQTDNYIRHVELSAPPSWRDRLSMRDPSTVAFNQLAKQAGTPSKKAKQSTRPIELATATRASSSSSSSASNYSTLFSQKDSLPKHSASHLARHGSTSTSASSRSGKGSISNVARKDTFRSMKSIELPMRPIRIEPETSSKKKPDISEPIIKDFQFARPATARARRDQDQSKKALHKHENSTSTTKSTTVRRIKFANTSDEEDQVDGKDESSPKTGGEGLPRSSILRSLSKRSRGPLKSIKTVAYPHGKKSSISSTSSLRGFSVKRHDISTH